MSEHEWLKFTYEELSAIETSLELSKTFLTNALDEANNSETPTNLNIEDAKHLIGIFDALLAKLDK